MKFFTVALLTTALWAATAQAGIYSEINGNVLGRGLPHEVTLPARSNHFLSFARRSEIIENYYRAHPDEEDVSFEVRTGSDALESVKRSDFGAGGAKKMHRRKKSSCTSGKKASSSSKPKVQAAAAASPKASPESKNANNKSTSSSSSSSSSSSDNSGTSGTYCYGKAQAALPFDELMSKTPSSFQSLKSTISQAAQQYQIQPQLLVAIADQESSFCTNTGNGAGCMQFTDLGTWAAYGSGSRSNNADSIWAAAKYLNYLGKKNGNLWDTLREYNGEVQNGGLATYQSDVYSKMMGNFW